MSQPTRFEVIKTTTDKLQEVLNDIVWSDADRNPELVKVEHTGGRDWVILIKSGSARSADFSLGVVHLADEAEFRRQIEKRQAARREGWLT